MLENQPSPQDSHSPSPIPVGNDNDKLVQASRRKRRWLWGGLAFLMVATCGIVATIVLANMVPSVAPEISKALGLDQLAGFYDEHYYKLSAAFSKRWDSDPSISSASTGFDTIRANGKTETWLVIEISYTGTCTSTDSDPCSRLANELAQIVFDNYSRVNELNGIRIIMGSQPHYLNVEPSDVILKKSLAIQEWRKELSLEK